MLVRSSIALAVMFTGSVWAQSVISAHSGTIHYKEGQVELDGKSVDQDSSKGQFGEVKTGQTLTVKDGQAEILLTPGVFLRVGENSSFTMLSNKLSDTRIEVLSGTAMVEVGELLQDNAITVKFHDSEIALGKKGLYRIDSDPARLRVYDGEAKVTTASQESALAVRKGHELLFGETLEAKAFDAKQTDAFYNWNARRDEYIAEANIYAAKSARDSGYGFGSGYSAFGTTGAYANGFGNGFGSWMYNPYFGMFTYMPFDGMFFSPFGYSYFSPGMVGYLYMPGSPFYYGGGYPTGVATARNGGSGLTPRSSGSPSGIVNRGGFTPGGFAGSRASSGGLGGVSASSGGGASSGVSRGGSGGMSSGGGGAHAGGGARR